MKLTLNGQTHDTDAKTVRDLVEELNLGEQAVAVELNREIVPKRIHETIKLKEGDVVEVVTLVGGG